MEKLPPLVLHQPKSPVLIGLKTYKISEQQIDLRLLSVAILAIKMKIPKMEKTVC